MMLDKLVQLPIWFFVLLVTTATVVAVLSGLYIKYRFFPSFRISPEDNQSANILIRLASTLLTVMLAFMVISIWKDYDVQRSNTEKEACVLGNLYRDARGTNPKTEAEVQRLIINYTKIVVEDGWPGMAETRESKAAWQAFNELYGFVIRINPESKKEEIVYSKLLNHINELASYRRLRQLRNQTPSMPAFMTGIIFLASFVNIIFSYLIRVENRTMHQIMVGLSGTMLGLVFSLILLLNNPYRSSVRVSPNPLKNLLDDVFPMADITLAQNSGKEEMMLFKNQPGR